MSPQIYSVYKAENKKQTRLSSKAIFNDFNQVYIIWYVYIYLHIFKCLTNRTSKWTRLQWNSLFVLFTPLLGYFAGVFQVLCLVALAVFGVVDQAFAPCISVHFFANLFWISWFVSSIGWRISFIYICVCVCVCVISIVPVDMSSSFHVIPCQWSYPVHFHGSLNMSYDMPCWPTFLENLFETTVGL